MRPQKWGLMMTCCIFFLIRPLSQEAEEDSSVFYRTVNKPRTNKTWTQDDLCCIPNGTLFTLVHYVGNRVPFWMQAWTPGDLNIRWLCLGFKQIMDKHPALSFYSSFKPTSAAFSASVISANVRKIVFKSLIIGRRLSTSISLHQHTRNNNAKYVWPINFDLISYLIHFCLFILNIGLL